MVNRIRYICRTKKFFVATLFTPLDINTPSSLHLNAISQETKKVGIIVFDGVEEIDFTAPLSVFGTWGLHYKGPQTYFTISERGEVRCAKGLTIKTDYTFSNSPAVNYLVVPGGQGTREARSNPQLLSFIQRMLAIAEQVLSVCTGSLLLASAGLLCKKYATTHWKTMELLKTSSEVKIPPAKLIKNDKFWVASGMTSGIDLVLAFIAHTVGEETAAKVQLHLEYFPVAVYGEISEHIQQLNYFIEEPPFV